MIRLNVFELDKIKKICKEVGTEYFTLETTNGSGIGNLLTLTYDTEIAEYPAKITIVVSGENNW